MYMEGVIWVSEPMNFWWVKHSLYLDVMFLVELDNH